MDQAGEFESWPPNFLYIGRGVPTRGIPRSEWCNTFKVKDYGRLEAVEMYKRRIKADDSMREKFMKSEEKYSYATATPENDATETRCGKSSQNRPAPPRRTMIRRTTRTTATKALHTRRATAPEARGHL